MSESLPSYSRFTSGVAGQAYNQTAFRHLLAIERRRAERSGRPLFLVLVALRKSSFNSRISDVTAAGIFRGLGDTVREVDFVGWFRERLVAGAVLTQGGVTAGEQTRVLIAERALRALLAHLPVRVSRRLRVRVVRFDPRTAQTRPEPAAVASGH